MKIQLFSWKFSNCSEMLQNLELFAKFQKFQQNNLVDFEDDAKREFSVSAVPLQLPHGISHFSALFVLRSGLRLIYLSSLNLVSVARESRQPFYSQR